MGNNPNQLPNDIALLKLAELVDLNMYTPACMAAKDADHTGKNGRVSGWGSLASCPAQDPTVLQEVEVNIISDEAFSAGEMAVLRTGCLASTPKLPNLETGSMPRSRKMEAQRSATKFEEKNTNKLGFIRI